MRELKELNESDWDLLLEKINSSSCVLVLGPDFYADQKLDSGEPIAIQLCRQLYGAIDHKPTCSDLPYLCEKYLRTFDSNGELNSRHSLVDKFRKFYENCESRLDPNSTLNPLSTLAALPFRLVITTSTDRFYDKALKSHGKQPQIVQPNYDIYKGSNSSSAAITQQKPLVFKLYGDAWNTQTSNLVLTESDLVRSYIKLVESPNETVPEEVRIILRERGTILLFYGFGLDQWYFRLLLMILRGTHENSETSFAIEPEAFFVSSSNSVKHAQFYFSQNYRIAFRFHEAKMFAEVLKNKFESKYKIADGRKEKKVNPYDKAKSLFLSYAREDSFIANKAYEALKHGGFSVWRDTVEHNGGEIWKNTIQLEIENSRLYFLIITNTLFIKPTGYVFEEIEIAVDFASKKNKQLKFIIPVYFYENAIGSEAEQSLTKFLSAHKLDHIHCQRINIKNMDLDSIISSLQAEIGIEQFESI